MNYYLNPFVILLDTKINGLKWMKRGWIRELSFKCVTLECGVKSGFGQQRPLHPRKFKLFSWFWVNLTKCPYLTSKRPQQSHPLWENHKNFPLSPSFCSNIIPDFFCFVGKIMWKYGCDRKDWNGNKSIKQEPNENAIMGLRNQNKSTNEIFSNSFLHSFTAFYTVANGEGRKETINNWVMHLFNPFPKPTEANSNIYNSRFLLDLQ